MKPMLATALPSDGSHELVFPVLATPKIDGIRALKVKDQLFSRTFKPIPNVVARKELERILPNGSDGELCFGATFQSATSAVMTASFVPPQGTKFRYYWFDYVEQYVDVPYQERMKQMKEKAEQLDLESSVVEIIPLYPIVIRNKLELDAYESACLSDGYEGVMIRAPNGKYKNGRSTLKEGLLLKIKQSVDDEALVIDTEELQHNQNEAEVDALGNKKRSSHKENKVSGGVLGALVSKTKDGIEFKIGTGFTAQMRSDLWKDRKSLIGKWVKYKYMPAGVKEAPRHPVFLGFRDINDM
jgi:DNA ligase-1